MAPPPKTPAKPSRKPETAKNIAPSQSTSKSKKNKNKPKEVVEEIIPVEEIEPSGSDAEELDDLESDEDEEDDVDEEGMARLMKVLGNDALDDFEQAQLRALNGEEDEDESDAGDSDGDVEDAGLEVSEDDEESESDDQEDQDEDIADDEEIDEDETEEEGIPLEELVEADPDAVPQQKKAEIDDTLAMQRIRDTIKLDSSLPWTETLVLSYPQSIDVDVNDDLNRELAFYKQALHSANEARSLASKHQFPFTRPSDYFAEMVKSDAHMERIRQRLLNETAGIKKSEDKRKEREGKKFGKQVQMEKLKEREKSKKEMEERLKGLKRKRKDVLDRSNTDKDDDAFDVAVEDAITDRPTKRPRANHKPGGLSRPARDKKFGFGGAGRRSKQNTRESTDSFVNSKKGGNGPKSGRHESKRLGKSRRATQKSRK